MNRGLRNNNPGNIRHGRSHWQGASADQPDKAFVKFDSLVMGYRAMWILLNNYWYVYGCKTLRQVIQRWAPPNENNTERYYQFIKNAITPLLGEQSPVDSGAIGDRREGVSKTRVRLPPNQNYALWQEIIVAMVRMEGNYTPDCRDSIREAYRRAFGKNP